MYLKNKIQGLVVLLLLAFFQPVFGQSKEDLFNGNSEITWLGMDFTQTKFIGLATQFKDAGEISNAEFRDKYVTAWNQLYINEPKKYDVAKQVHRTEVKYGMDVTEKANNSINKEFFSNNPDDFMNLDKEKVAALVKKYNFQGKTGIGLIIFVEGMSKAKEQASAWVTYVNMKDKTVLLTSRVTGKTGGFGFRNYWAKAFYNILQKADYKDLKES